MTPFNIVLFYRTYDYFHVHRGVRDIVTSGLLRLLNENKTSCITEIWEKN